MRSAGTFDISELRVYPRELNTSETNSAEQAMGASSGTHVGCTVSQPCANGVGQCTANTCAPGLTCGYGMGERFGLTASDDVCWDPHAGGTVAGNTDSVIPDPSEYRDSE